MKQVGGGWGQRCFGDLSRRQNFSLVRPEIELLTRSRGTSEIWLVPYLELSAARHMPPPRWSLNSPSTCEMTKTKTKTKIQGIQIESLVKFGKPLNNFLTKEKLLMPSFNVILVWRCRVFQWRRRCRQIIWSRVTRCIIGHCYTVRSSSMYYVQYTGDILYIRRKHRAYQTGGGDAAYKPKWHSHIYNGEKGSN